MRSIIESEQFAKDVAELGGYRAIDLALEPIIEALMANPYGFEMVANDWCSIRFARTRMIERYVPPLIVAFTIDQHNNVVLEWVEVADEAV
ncbi:MAG: hypothetical protein ACK4VM_08400 [Bosea sp. (in: a-proteobacteria)]